MFKFLTFQSLFLTLFLLQGCQESATAPDPTPSASTSLCSGSDKTSETGLPPQLAYSVVARYPHDPAAFSQGLVYKNGKLYESTGLYGQSSLRIIDFSTQQLEKNKALDETLFGEGLTLFNNELIQLTWKSGQVFRYSLPELQTLAQYNIDGEGWGITHNGDQLISSDGSATLSFRDPKSLQVQHTITSRFAGRPLARLNELEWIDGCLFANIWHTDSIAIIDPASGTTRYTLDISALAAPEKLHNPEHVANGIAYRADTGHLLLTGKNWRWLYEIKLTFPQR